MLATFQVKNSTIHLNGVDISGLSNTVEVTISAKTDKQVNAHLHGKVGVTIKQKIFLKKSNLDNFINLCEDSQGGTFRFTRESLQYTMEGVELLLSKQDSIAGVVPVELFIGGDVLPLRTRILN